MSTVHRERESDAEGTAYTFLKPMPTSRPAPPDVAGMPMMSVDEVASALFPPRESNDACRASGTSLGPYRIEDQIGRGGMGAVFRAVDARLDRVVALKVLSPELSRDQSAVPRFQNEARAAARLDHDNIAKVHDVGHDHGLYYIAFEFVPGINLRDLLSRHTGPFSPSEAVSYTLQIADALRQTAAADVVHRDIKPSNIIISPSGRAKLVDWGLARQNSVELSQELTQTGTTLGTFDYISPEQAVDPRNVDVRSDIYSLGCTLFHMLTGEPPYPRGSMFQKVIDHHRPEPPDPSKRNPSVSSELSRIVRRMMASDPAQRYATPEDVIQDLSLLAPDLGLRPVSGFGGSWMLQRTSDGPRLARAGWGWLGAFVALILLVLYLDRPTTRIEPAGESILPAAVRGPDHQERQANAAQAIAPPEPEIETPARGVREGLGFAHWSSHDPTPQSIRDSSPVTSPAAAGGTPARFALIPDLGGEPQAFTTLEKACLAAADNDVIELGFSGLLECPEPLRITGKRLVIRAAGAMRPLLVVGPRDFAETSGDQRPARMVTLSGPRAELEFQNVDLILRIPSGNSRRWTLFSMSQNQRISLRGVSVTIENPQRLPASIFEVAALGPSAMSGGAGESNPPRARIDVKSCVVRGAGTFIWHDSGDLVDVRIEQSALALSGGFYWRSAVNSLADVMAPRDNANQIAMTHVTGLFEDSLLHVDLGDQGETRPFNIDCRDSILVLVSTKAPLVSMTGHGDVDKYVDLLQWTGTHNYYDVDTDLWVIQVSRDGPYQSWDFPGWKQKWNSLGDVLISAQLFERPSTSSRTEFTDIQTDDFALRSTRETLNPPVRGASDLRDAGVDLSQPELPLRLPTVNPRSALQGSLPSRHFE